MKTLLLDISLADAVALVLATLRKEDINIHSYDLNKGSVKAYIEGPKTKKTKSIEIELRPNPPGWTIRERIRSHQAEDARGQRERHVHQRVDDDFV